MSVERSLLAALGFVLSAVAVAARLPDGPRKLLASLGWDLPPSVDDIGLAALDLGRVGARLNAWAALVADPAAPAEQEALALGELADAVLDAVDDLASVRLEAPQEYLDRTNIVDEFLTRLSDLYLVQALATASRPSLEVALLLGLVELRREAADPARFQVEHLRHVVRWDRLELLATDPGALARDVYGWGTPAFDATTLVGRIGAALQPLALDVRIRELPAIPLARLHRGAAPPAGPAQTQVLLTLLGASGPLAGEAGLSVFGLPPTSAGGADGGIGLAPYADATAELRIPLSSRLSLGMAAGGDLGSGFAIVLRPGAEPALRTGLNEERAGEGSPGARIGVDLTLAVADGEEPMRLADAGGVTLSARRLAAALEVGVDAEGTDAALRLALAGGRLAVGGGAVSPLASALPDGGLTTDVDVALEWSHRGGLRLDGRAELRTRRSIGRSLGPLRIDAVELGLAATGDGAELIAAAAATLTIGPARLSVDGAGLRGALVPGPGNLGSADLALRPRAPATIGIDIDAGAVKGGGLLLRDEARGQYAGAVELEFEGIAVKAVGLLTTRPPDGFSLLVLVSAEFEPVQLGLGFTLQSVGGLLGINRTVAVEALRGGLKTGALGPVLSPPDPRANPQQVVAGIAAVFPVAAGRHVFGPLARIGWGTPTIVTIDVCLVLELPSPVRLVVLGRLRAVLPDEREPVAVLQMDLLGVVDFDRRSAAVDATLVDSRLAGFALTGDMALRMSWGEGSTFLLAVGGFHPRFAAPPGFPALERVAVALATGDNPRLRLEAYLALTSNTVQLGARVDLSARAGRFTVGGFLSFDALVTLEPLSFEVDIAAKLGVKAGDRTILSVSLALTLSGPQPWRARGRATFSILFFDVSFRFDVTIGDDAPPALPEPVDVGALLHAALSDARAWSAQLPAGGAAVVTLRALDPGDDVLVHPLGTLAVRQRVAPLERTLERFGARVPSGARTFRIADATVGGAGARIDGLTDLFAPGQFRDLSDDERLAAPSFEAMASGAVIGARDVAHGAPVIVGLVYEQKIVTAEGVPEPRPDRSALPGDVFAALLATPRAAGARFGIRDTA